MKTKLIIIVSMIQMAGASATAIAAAPQIKATTSLQHTAVDLGKNTSFAVTAVGDAPLSYQWRRDRSDLLNQTNKTLTLTKAQPEDEGDYSVVVTNAFGSATNAPARLWVVPSESKFIKRNFTNNAGLRLPYFYLLPENYDTARDYPLVCVLHGMPGDEIVITTPNYGYLGYLNYPATKTFVSYRQQATDPVILLWPTRRAGDSSWTTGPRGYLQQVSDLLDQLLLEFKVDTNRVYVTGGSEGLHAAWDLIGMRPGFFAAAYFQAGWSGSTPVRVIKDVPAWVWAAADDELVVNTRGLVDSLRRAGGKPIYTEYNSGGHFDAILMGNMTPAIVDWLLAQRRGVPGTAEPLVSITSPIREDSFTTAAPILDLAGSADALGQNVTQVGWRSATYSPSRTGLAVGTNLWSASGIPLQADKTNVIIVTATTISWAPAFGGNTTFNHTLTVLYSPIRVTLALQGPDAVLNWTRGVGPYSVQRASDLGLGHWIDFATSAAPPLMLPLEGKAGFYCVLGQ